MPEMHKRPDLSVIIPVYNLESYILPMINSLNAQKTEYSVEHIFVLNNCTDKSEEVIRNNISCNIFAQKIQGCGPARNMGFENSTGEYVWFMDGDDWLLSDTAIQEAIDTVRGRNIIRVPFQSDNFKYNYYSMVWQYVFKRDFIKEFRFRKEQPAEDDVYMTQVLSKAGYDNWSYLGMPRTRPLYFYNYMRVGSNMYRVYNGENINGD